MKSERTLITPSNVLLGSGDGGHHFPIYAIMLFATLSRKMLGYEVKLNETLSDLCEGGKLL